MLWILLIVLFFVLLIYLLFLPIDIVVNTDKGLYSIRLGVLARMLVFGDVDKVLRIQLNTFFMKFNFFPVEWRFKKKEKKSKSKRHKKNRLPNLGTIRRFLGSFEVKSLVADIDTGNVLINARYFPVVAFLNFYFGTRLGINFQGRNRLVLHIRNRPINILRSFINPKKLYHGITL